jgi:hypothetical protein
MRHWFGVLIAVLGFPAAAAAQEASISQSHTADGNPECLAVVLF